MKQCEVCGARVEELRRGRCWGCYTRWSETRPVGLGAVCAVCGERRRSFLRSVELLGAWVPMCHNCAHRATSLDPLPQSVAEIRRALERDRRFQSRRVGKQDTRVFPRERRTGDRRRVRAIDHDDPVVIDEAMIVEIADVPGVAKQHDREADADLTRIRELPLVDPS